MRYKLSPALLLLALSFNPLFVKAQEVDLMSPETAQQQALELYKQSYRAPEWLSRLGLSKLAEHHYAKKVDTYSAGDPQLIRALKPSAALLNSDRVKELCLNSDYFNTYALEGEELTTCLAELRGEDAYEVPLYDANGEYIDTVSFAAQQTEDGSSSWGIIRNNAISAERAKSLLAVDEVNLYSLNLFVDAPPEPDDWIGGTIFLWLAGTQAVNYHTGESYLVTDLNGKPVNLLANEVEPYVVEKSFVGRTGNEMRPKLVFPIKLEPLTP